ncbi:hypothetical protein K505DRAFT_320224 [Melanomma pulvis-pyrius CBS 109.77]|uniref:Uncharacterized protein n=1 Tax=Melanomma pulvis-pyrius CBS 109.77 TaxID=1314802 RepID=A0A6A6XWM7_9PLEO|nr:hypothetical protein K505DRAFT_320224 [Melanomma pulvis-pyrius CBS 109.77]
MAHVVARKVLDDCIWDWKWRPSDRFAWDLIRKKTSPRFEERWASPVCLGAVVLHGTIRDTYPMPCGMGEYCQPLQLAEVMP